MTITQSLEKNMDQKFLIKNDKELAKQKKQLVTIRCILEQQGLTEETAKKQTCSNVLLEYAVNQALRKISKSLTKAALNLTHQKNSTNYQVRFRRKQKKC